MLLDPVKGIDSRYRLELPCSPCGYALQMWTRTATASTTPPHE